MPKTRLDTCNISSINMVWREYVDYWVNTGVPIKKIIWKLKVPLKIKIVALQTGLFGLAVLLDFSKVGPTYRMSRQPQPNPTS